MRKPPRRLLRQEHADAVGHTTRWYVVTIEREKRTDLGRVYVEACCFPVLIERLTAILETPFQLKQFLPQPTYYRKTHSWRAIAAAKVAGKPGRIVIEYAAGPPAERKDAYRLLPPDPSKPLPPSVRKAREAKVKRAAGAPQKPRPAKLIEEEAKPKQVR